MNNIFRSSLFVYSELIIDSLNLYNHCHILLTYSETETCPNITENRAMGAIRYLLYKRYVEVGNIPDTFLHCFLLHQHKDAIKLYPLSDRQLENLRAVFGRGVKKRNGRRLAGNPADFVNTLASEFWVFLRFQSCTLSRITKSQL